MSNGCVGNILARVIFRFNSFPIASEAFASNLHRAQLDSHNPDSVNRDKRRPRLPEESVQIWPHNSAVFNFVRREHDFDPRAESDSIGVVSIGIYHLADILCFAALRGADPTPVVFGERQPQDTDQAP